MKNLRLFSAVAIAGMVLIASCSVEKRMHRPGYNVTFNKNIKSKGDVKDAEKVDFNEVAEVNEKENSFKADPIKEEKENKFSAKLSKETKKSEVKRESKPAKLNAKASKPAKTNTIRTEESSNSEYAAEEFTNSSSAKSNSNMLDVKIIIGIILLFFIPPLGVYIGLGSGSEFRTNLFLFLGGILLMILGVIIGIASASLSGGFILLSLYAIGAIVLLISFIHGLIVLIRNL